MKLLKAISDGTCPQICEWEEEVYCEKFIRKGYRTVNFIRFYCRDCHYDCTTKLDKKDEVYWRDEKPNT